MAGRAVPEGGWESLTVDELKDELEARELPKSGKKAELVERLEQSDAGTADAPEGPDEADAPERRPARRRRRAEAHADEPDRPLVVRARARYVRSAPRKARLVMDHIRGRPVEQARAILAHTPRAVSVDVAKLLESAIANAEANHELAADELRIYKAFVDEGPTIKRYRPRALGRATRINKRTSHMTIELTATGEGA
jgi:ribosomal protein L22